MRRLMMCIGLLALFSCCAYAQTTTPQWDVFAGYSYLRANPGGGFVAANASGWEAAATWNWNHWLGLKADFDGHYCCDGQHEHNFLFGPQFTMRRHRANVFFHALGGVSHGSTAGFSETTPAWVFGGGLDLKFERYPRLAFRVVQADYLGTNYADEVQHNFRYSAGIVVQFGKK